MISTNCLKNIILTWHGGCNTLSGDCFPTTGMPGLIFIEE